jgi:hypothetical protein
MVPPYTEATESRGEHGDVQPYTEAAEGRKNTEMFSLLKVTLEHF